MRPHFVRARVKVHVYPGGSHAVFHGPRCIGRYDEKGRIKDAVPIQRAAELRSAARLWKWDNAVALPPVPQGNKTRRSGQTTYYQNRTTSFAIDIDRRPSRSLSAKSSSFYGDAVQALYSSSDTLGSFLTKATTDHRSL